MTILPLDPARRRAARAPIVPVLPERPLPMDLDAEQATLGALLTDRDAIVAVAPWLQAEHFVLEKHAWIYDAVLACYGRRVPPDLCTVSDELRRLGRLEPLGGMPFLVSLSIATPTAVHVEYYAQIVERTASLRRLIQAGGQIAALGYDEALEDAERLARVQQALETALARPGMHALLSSAEAMDALFADLGRTDVSGIATGLAALDTVTDGFQRGDLILSAARPGMGKTGLALQLVLNMSSQGATVLFCSLEMGTMQLLQRLLANRTGINLQAIRRRDLNEAQLERITTEISSLADLPFYLDETASLTVAELRIKAQALQVSLAAEGRTLDLIIVDYLQLMQPAESERRSSTRTEDVSSISRGLKQLARELQVPILALSQLSRAVEMRASHVPMLSDLRDSGALEQDADLVIFIYREEVYAPDTDKRGIAELHIAKHRNGPLAVIPVSYDAATQRWRDVQKTDWMCDH